MSTLYELTAEAKALAETLEAEEGDLDKLGDQFLATLDANAADLSAKLDGYCGLILHYAAMQKMHEDAAQAQAAKAASFSNRKDWLKLRMKEAMTLLRMAKHEGLHTARVQNNGGAQKLSIIGTVPTAYMRQPPPEPDTDAIRKGIEKGLPIDFARLEPRGTHIVIK